MWFDFFSQLKYLIYIGKLSNEAMMTIKQNTDTLL